MVLPTTVATWMRPRESSTDRLSASSTNVGRVPKARKNRDCRLYGQDRLGTTSSGTGPSKNTVSGGALAISIRTVSTYDLPDLAAHSSLYRDVVQTVPRQMATSTRASTTCTASR